MDHLPELAHHSVPKKKKKQAGTQGWDRHVTQATFGDQLAGVIMETQVEINRHIGGNSFFFLNHTTAHLYFLSPLYIKSKTSDVSVMSYVFMYKA